MQQGDVLEGKYSIERLLGVGGMGEVWLATERELDRHVALKRIKPEYMADRGFVGRFKREGVKTAKLSHHRIVRVLTSFESEGSLWLVLEYIEGQNLDEALKSGGLDPDAKAHVLRDVLEGLVYLHTEPKIAHRDIKPANILLDTRGRARIADFGIALSLDRSSDSSTQPAAAGSPGFIAPELVNGDDATTSSDVWAFGAVALLAFAGQLPKAGIPEGNFAGPLTAPIRAALNQDPAHRPAAEQLLAAWDVSLAGTSMAAATATVPQMIQAPALRPEPPRHRPRRVALIAVAGAALGIAALLGAQNLLGSPAPQQPQAAASSPAPTVTVTETVTTTPTPTPSLTPTAGASTTPSPSGPASAAALPGQGLGPKSFNLTDIRELTNFDYAKPLTVTIKTTPFSFSLQGGQYSNNANYIEYGLGGACTQLKVSVGQDAKSPRIGGPITFQVFLDDVEKAQSVRGPYDDPDVMTVDLTGATRMKLADNKTYEDGYSVWGSPVVTCKYNPNPN